MPRALKTDKFFIGSVQKKGPAKGKIVLSFNCLYNGETDKITLQDLIDFLKEKGVKPSAVKVPNDFFTLVTK